MFTSHLKKGAKPSTSTEQGSQLHDEDLIEHEFQLVDLETENEPSNMQHTIKEKYSQIRELMDNMARARFVISFLEQENNQLKARQLIMEKEQTKLLQKIGKGKVVLKLSEPKQMKKQGKKKWPRTNGLKKALKDDKEHNLLDEDLDMEDKIALEIDEDRKYWLDKLNDHL